MTGAGRSLCREAGLERRRVEGSQVGRARGATRSQTAPGSGYATSCEDGDSKHAAAGPRTLSAPGTRLRAWKALGQTASSRSSKESTTTDRQLPDFPLGHLLQRLPRRSSTDPQPGFTGISATCRPGCSPRPRSLRCSRPQPPTLSSAMPAGTFASQVETQGDLPAEQRKATTALADQAELQRNALADQQAANAKQAEVLKAQLAELSRQPRSVEREQANQIGLLSDEWRYRVPGVRSGNMTAQPVHMARVTNSSPKPARDVVCRMQTQPNDVLYFACLVGLGPSACTTLPTLTARRRTPGSGCSVVAASACSFSSTTWRVIRASSRCASPMTPGCTGR